MNFATWIKLKQLSDFMFYPSFFFSFYAVKLFFVQRIIFSFKIFFFYFSACCFQCVCHLLVSSIIQRICSFHSILYQIFETQKKNKFSINVCWNFQWEDFPNRLNLIKLFQIFQEPQLNNLFSFKCSGGLEKDRFICFVSKFESLIYPPKPYKVRPWRFKAYTTSMAVTVFLFACSVYVTASRMTFSRKTFNTPRVSS